MKKKGLLLLLLPFVIMIIINEGCRLLNREQNPYMLTCLHIKVKAINSDEQNSDKCTWNCHNNTTKYCIVHHVKAKSLIMAENKQLYFGSIKFLKIFGAYTSTTIFDAYAVTNILVYILVFPLWIWFWIIKILKICKKR
jgi:hypothetical protein